MQALILLHGALGAPGDFKALENALKNRVRTYTFAFSGHAQRPFTDDFGMPLFTQELAEFVNAEGLERPHVFGYSMGGYVALNLARNAKNPLGSIITLGTKFNWSADTVAKETAALDPEKILQKVPAFATLLESKHGSSWKELLHKTAGMMQELSRLELLNPQALAGISSKVLIGLADKDQMVSLDETVNVFKALPKASMYMLPGTKHQIESANAELLADVILNFLNEK